MKDLIERKSIMAFGKITGNYKHHIYYDPTVQYISVNTF